jgi:uncharacterized membrane protein YhaH (DUF805 family)
MTTPNDPYNPYPSGSQDAGQQQDSYGQQAPYGQPPQGGYAPYGGAPYGQQQGPYGQQYGQYGGYGQPPMGQYQPGYGAPYAPAGPDGYLRGGAVGFGDAIKLAFKNSFVYQGRASRSAYWWVALFSGIVGFVFDMVFGVAVGASAHSPAAALLATAPLYLVMIGMVIVTLPLLVRRLHDIDRSGFWLFLSLVPFVGGIVIFVFTLLEGTRGPNRFG